MTRLNEIYKCNVCGNIVEMVHAGRGQLVCCGRPMELLAEKSQEAGTEKHLPVVEKTETGILVKVGEVPHPMEEKHFIEFIEVISGGKALRKYLRPGEKPEAEFGVSAEKAVAREYCSVHGLWKRE